MLGPGFLVGGVSLEVESGGGGGDQHSWERFPQRAMPKVLSVPHASDVDRGVSSCIIWGPRILCSWTQVSFRGLLSPGSGMS